LQAKVTRRTERVAVPINHQVARVLKLIRDGDEAYLRGQPEVATERYTTAVEIIKWLPTPPRLGRISQGTRRKLQRIAHGLPSPVVGERQPFSSGGTGRERDEGAFLASTAFQVRGTITSVDRQKNRFQMDIGVTNRFP